MVSYTSGRVNLRYWEENKSMWWLLVWSWPHGAIYVPYYQKLHCAPLFIGKHGDYLNVNSHKIRASLIHEWRSTKFQSQWKLKVKISKILLCLLWKCHSENGMIMHGFRRQSWQYTGTSSQKRKIATKGCFFILRWHTSTQGRSAVPSCLLQLHFRQLFWA